MCPHLFSNVSDQLISLTHPVYLVHISPLNSCWSVYVCSACFPASSSPFVTLACSPLSLCVSTDMFFGFVPVCTTVFVFCLFFLFLFFFFLPLSPRCLWFIWIAWTQHLQSVFQHTKPNYSFSQLEFYPIALAICSIFYDIVTKQSNYGNLSTQSQY